MLRSTNRERISELIEFLDKEGFFIAPASSRFHLSVEGGLLKHSLNLHDTLKKLIDTFGIEFPEDSLIICSLLHDVCKSKLYLKAYKEYAYNNKEGDKGHGTYSVQIISKFIWLSDFEKECIKHHMGWYSKDVPSTSIIFAFEDKRQKLFYFADDITAQFIDSKEQISEGLMLDE